MIIFAFLAFLIFGLIAIAGGFVLKWLSSLLSPRISAITGREEAKVELFVQTALLFIVTSALLFLSHRSCSYGNSFRQEGQKVVSVEEIAYMSLGWVLLVMAIVCFGIIIWRLKITIYGRKPKTKKVF